ncbi:MAG: hypothetical protein KTR16_15670 [Acidiferrobacterales bacterium]|nr:hypothetical protein [Acidiferrobacterales bacterium]
MKFYSLSKQAFLAVVLLCFAISAQARQEIRFYEANKHLQTDRVSFTAKKARQAGCHNFLARTRVYQANQLGYASCSVFAEKDCVPDSVVEVNRTKDDTAVTSLSQGFSWFPIDENERGAILRSWSCELESQTD